MTAMIKSLLRQYTNFCVLEDADEFLVFMKETDM